jgi:ABC-type transporter Mla subunit MlaD
MTGNELQRNILAALAAVRDCAAQMDEYSERLLKVLPTTPMDEALRTTAVGMSANLKDTAGRVTFEVALLQAQLGEAKANAANVIQALSSMDATMMGALASAADVVDELEKAAELDERNEQPFVLLIEATGVMLQGLERAKAATQALRPAV